MGAEERVGRGRGYQKLKEKVCEFPDCTTVFIARGKAKYCEEHRKPKYRKDLYKQNDNNGDGVKHFAHDSVCSSREIMTCSLKGCDNTYEVILTPRLFEYPSYCDEHRNPYKRKRFMDEQKESSDE